MELPVTSLLQQQHDDPGNPDKDQSLHVLLEGYAIKVGSWFGGNAYRWFTLRSDFTILSSMDKESAAQPSKAYSLSGCHVEWGQLGSKEYAVRIECQRKHVRTGKIGVKKMLTLIVEDVGSMNLWVSGLRCLFAGTNRILCTEGEIGGSTCAICLADFTAGEELIVLPCEHRFCSAGCIERWIVISSNCPLCKQDCKVHGEPMLRKGVWQGGAGGEGKGKGSAGESKV